MGMMIRILFPLIGYLSVATVITLAAGYGYLRRSGNLDDDRLFQIVSVLHNIDMDEIAKQQQTDEQDVPPEEPSYKQQQEQTYVATLHHQAKADDLAKQRREFHDLRQQVDTKMLRFQEFSEEVTTFLDKQKDKALQTGMTAVREQWKNLAPKKQTKELLKMFFEANRMDSVILLLNGMPSTKRTDILKTLDEPDDLKMLYEIQQEMLAGNPEKTFIDEKIKELEQNSDLENN